MRSRRILAALVAATATAAVAPGVASAADDAWTYTYSETQAGHTLTESANGRIVAVTNGSLDILVDCKAMATSTPPG